MDMQIVSFAIILVLVLALGVVAKKLKDAKYIDESTYELFNKVTGVVITQKFNEAILKKVPDTDGVDSIKRYVSAYVLDAVIANENLPKELRAVVTEEMIEGIVGPQIEALWKAKLEMPNKFMTKATLDKVRSGEIN